MCSIKQDTLSLLKVFFFFFLRRRNQFCHSRSHNCNTISHWKDDSIVVSKCHYKSRWDVEDNATSPWLLDLPVGMCWIRGLFKFRTKNMVMLTRKLIFQLYLSFSFSYRKANHWNIHRKKIKLVPSCFFLLFFISIKNNMLACCLFWKQYNLQQYNTIEETTENAVLLWHPHWVHWPGSDMLYMYTLLINLKKGSCFHFAYRQLLKF